MEWQPEQASIEVQIAILVLPEVFSGRIRSNNAITDFQHTYISRLTKTDTSEPFWTLGRRNLDVLKPKTAQKKLKNSCFLTFLTILSISVTVKIRGDPCLRGVTGCGDSIWS